jgi:hypothetical protein
MVQGWEAGGSCGREIRQAIRAPDQKLKESGLPNQTMFGNSAIPRVYA